MLVILVSYVFYNWKFVPLTHLYLFCPRPRPSGSHEFVLFRSLFLFVCSFVSCCVFRFRIDALCVFLRLTSLSIIRPGSIHVVAVGRIPFLFTAEEYFIAYIYHIFFVHSSMDEHLDLLCLGCCKLCHIKQRGPYIFSN